MLKFVGKILFQFEKNLEASHLAMSPIQPKYWQARNQGGEALHGKMCWI